MASLSNVVKMAKPLQVEVVLSHGEHLPVVDVWLVIDILRASTVIVSWFAEGGAALYPVASVEAARSLAESMRQKGETPVLMGEHNAVAPDGFDLGNSPSDITKELVQNASCAVMATTNGTKALLQAASTGAPVLVACARNALAALELALSKGSRIGIFCSGRKGRPAWDDTLCAGLLISCLMERFPDTRLADSARLAHLTWLSSKDFKTSLKSADHAVFLDKIGFDDDIAFASEIGAADVVPELHEVPDGDGMQAVLRPAPQAGSRKIFTKRISLPENSAMVQSATPIAPPRQMEEFFSQKPEPDDYSVFFAGESYKRRRKDETRKKIKRY